MLALKYRPRNFDDLVGQNHIVTILTSLLRRDSLPAGLLFSGGRGTGKTTSARVIAAVLNCNNCSDIVACGSCDNCRSVHLSNCPFVHEIDAASNNSVDDIRRLKEHALYSHQGMWRVFILDEAHSLSDSAFQALLKQLEEPPPYTLFVLATTAPEDIPETVLSRLMQFDFVPISAENIEIRLRHIANKEKLPIEDHRVFRALAEKAQGGMRDAIMAMEQLSNYKQSNITLSDFHECFGLVGLDVVIALLDAARGADIVKAKEIITASFNRGGDASYFLDKFMGYVFDALAQRIITSEQATNLYKAAVEVKSRLRHMSSHTAMSYLFAMLLSVFHQDSVVNKPQSIAGIEDVANILG